MGNVADDRIGIAVGAFNFNADLPGANQPYAPVRTALGENDVSVIERSPIGNLQ